LIDEEEPMFEQTRRIFLDSLERVLNGIARLVPGLLAMALILLISGLVASLLRAGIHRVCARIGLDHRAKEWGLLSPGDAPGASALLSRLGAWTVMAIGFLLGLRGIEAASAVALSERLATFLPNVVMAIVILAIGLAGARTLERRVLIGAVNTGLQSAHLLGLGARWLVVVFASAVALEQLGIGGTVVVLSFGILFGGIVLALALAIGFGSRRMVARSLDRHFGPPKQTDKPGQSSESELRHL
jgi:hypothetical protein